MSTNTHIPTSEQSLHSSSKFSKMDLLTKVHQTDDAAVDGCHTPTGSVQSSVDIIDHVSTTTSESNSRSEGFLSPGAGDMSPNGYLSPHGYFLNRNQWDRTPMTEYSMVSNGYQSEVSDTLEFPQSVSRTRSPIAICGMALRLPAGVKTPQQLWNFLLAGSDARSVVPASRYNVSAFHGPHDKPSTVIAEHGYFLDEDIGAFDNSFFSMPRIEVERSDPQQRLLLEVTREAFEDAGETAWRGKRIGCYVGSLGEDWCEMYARETQNYGTYRASGCGDWSLANRVSYEFDLQGPSMSTRTACSAGLVALHSACLAINSGDCESAVVAGVNLIMTPGTTMSMTEQGVLSVDGSCKTFTSDVNGYARGEAITAIFVKKLDDAIRDGNSIRAIIRGTSTNHDGKTPGMSVPDAKAQETLIRHAYDVAGIKDVHKTGYFECHGTGTPIGDPIEAKAVASVFGKQGMHIGSVKANFGHTEGASGILSVIKSVLSLEHKTIAPQIKFTNPNPAIPFKDAKLTVPTEPTPWPQGRAERISVNSFGVGGSNAHVILDSPTKFINRISRVQPPSETQPAERHLLLFSANSQTVLSNLIQNHREHLESNPASAENLAFTLATKREHLPYRAFAIAEHGTLTNVSPANKAQKAPAVVMVFTGQGAQWPQMGRDLLDSNPVFMSSIKLLNQYLQELGNDAPSWDIELELRKIARRSRVNKAEFSQTLCSAIQIALVDTFAAIGIRPHAVVGHSSGEIAAAYAAGALSAKDAIVTAWYRGIVAGQQNRPGAMAALGMSWDEATAYLVPGTTIACDNSPSSVTISGDIDAIETVLTNVHTTRTDVLARKLQVDKAYHSDHMREVGDRYCGMLEGKVFAKQPTIPFFSSVTASLVSEGAALGPRYWQQNLESSVLFKSAVSQILEHEVGKNAILLELGPHSALAGPLRQIMAAKGSSVPYVSALIRNQNSAETYLSTIGQLFTQQVPVCFDEVFSRGTCLPDLPRYPYDHSQSYWYESRLSKDYRLRKHAHHDLLGVRLVESTDIEPAWRNLLHLNTAPWIRDHKVGADIVFPFAGYIAMAGEAVRQTTDVDKAFRLRHIIVHTALVIPEDRPTEVITTLRPHRLTDSLDSKWYEFTVCAHDGVNWTKYCTGQVKSESEHAEESTDPAIHSRKVNMRMWFDRLRQQGLDLGPAFVNVTEATAATIAQAATAKLLKVTDVEARKYHIHPTVVDGALQLMGVAFHNGLARKFKNRLPTTCEEIMISRVETDLQVAASGKNSGSSILGFAHGVSNGNTVMSISGLKLNATDSSDITILPDTHAAARLQWGPDMEFLSQKHLPQPVDKSSQYWNDLEDLFHLCVVYSQRCTQGLQATKAHLTLYKEWLNDQLALLSNSSFLTWDDEAILAKVDAIAQSLAHSSVASAAIAMQEVCKNASALYAGKISSWEDVLSHESASELHKLFEDWNTKPFFEHFTHNKPNMRVLEIGSWSTAPSQNILEQLTLPNGTPLCSKYVFASKDYIPAQKRESESINVENVTIDIGQDLLTQGFEAQQFDVIIASNAIHTTQNLESSLSNIRQLLRPNGRLLLQELCPTSKWPNFIMGTSSRWWCGAEDKRSTEPYVNSARWRKALALAGYEAIEAPRAAAYHFSNLFVAVNPVDSETPRRITVLCNKEESNSSPILLELKNQGFEISRCTIYDRPVAGRDIIAVLDAEKPFFDKIDSETFNAFKTFVENLQDSRLLWVTMASQMNCHDPRFAQSIGIARTIRSELLVDFGTVEVDDFKHSATQIVQVFSKFQRREEGESTKIDFEYSIQDGTVNVGRFYPFALSEDLATSEENDQAMLDVAIPGRINSLHWVRKAATPVLEPTEVEIDMFAVGLNFRDLLVAMNIVQLQHGRAFGCEGSGVIRRVGKDVKNFKVGDRVAAVVYNTFQTRFVIVEDVVVKVPDMISMQEAATSFFPYVTAMWSIFNVGGLEEGMSILIHSACGGVGLAAVQLAQMVGAEVYCTVGSEEKVQYLMNNHNIPRNRIFNSRDRTFLDGVMRETNNVGVDMVLNSLSGDLLHVTWQCVAPFGKLIEIGKRDLIGHGKLDMNPFLANRSYCCVDIDPLTRTRPKTIGRLMAKLADHFEKGDIKTLQPIEVFDGADPARAFRFMAPGQHIGRICIMLRGEDGRSNIDSIAVNRQSTLSLKPSASYLLIGGLGGLGRSVSTWLIEHGAQNLVYLSRSAGKGSEDQSFATELNSMGCQVQFVQGSVSNLADVERAIAEAKAPIKGVIQMSMVLRDSNFYEMSIEDWNAVVEPKVQGTWNLHHASVSAGLDLDFFVMFSSLSGTIGQIGQANYASANTFLDAFVQYRNGMGLAATAIDIGAVAEVGVIAQNKGMMQKMVATGYKPLAEQEVLDALLVATTRKAPSKETGNSSGRYAERNSFIVGLGSSIPLNSEHNRAVWKNDRRMALYHNTSGDDANASSGGTDLKAYINGAKSNPAILKTPECVAYIATEIGKKSLALLLKTEEDLNISWALTDLGLDSLAAIELRAWWKQAFSFDITVAEMLGFGSLEALGQKAADGLYDGLVK